jgi:hypothetical protein
MYRGTLELTDTCFVELGGWKTKGRDGAEASGKRAIARAIVRSSV